MILNSKYSIMFAPSPNAAAFSNDAFAAKKKNEVKIRQ